MSLALNVRYVVLLNIALSSRKILREAVAQQEREKHELAVIKKDGQEHRQQLDSLAPMITALSDDIQRAQADTSKLNLIGNL
ncbi:hypothetical protein OH492_26565 [Vibrio chagasii]|nr:hypothetical protein [Vibrio chagasii]